MQFDDATVGMVQRRLRPLAAPETDADPVQPVLFENCIVPEMVDAVTVPLMVPAVLSENCVLIWPVTLAPACVKVAVTADTNCCVPPENGV